MWASKGWRFLYRLNSTKFFLSRAVKKTHKKQNALLCLHPELFGCDGTDYFNKQVLLNILSKRYIYIYEVLYIYSMRYSTDFFNKRVLLIAHSKRYRTSTSTRYYTSTVWGTLQTYSTNEFYLTHTLRGTSTSTRYCTSTVWGTGIPSSRSHIGSFTHWVAPSTMIFFPPSAICKDLHLMHPSCLILFLFCIYFPLLTSISPLLLFLEHFFSHLQCTVQLDLLGTPCTYDFRQYGNATRVPTPVVFVNIPSNRVILSLEGSFVMFPQKLWGLLLRLVLKV